MSDMEMIPTDEERERAAVLKAYRARITELEGERDTATRALRDAAEWFEGYEFGHLAKGDTDKAKRNGDRAKACRAALSKTEAKG